MTDPNSPESIALRKAALEQEKVQILRKVALVLACKEGRVDFDYDDAEPDLSPRFESLMYPVYIGIWLYQIAGQKWWMVEVDKVKDDASWLEDGVERGEIVQHAAFTTFKDALAAANSVIETLAEMSYFENV